MDRIGQRVLTTTEQGQAKGSRGQSSSVDLTRLRERIAPSPEEQQRIKNEATQQKLKQLEQEKQLLRQQLEDANKHAKAQQKSAETQNKCIAIAMRIMSGDTVPRGDYRFLSQNNPELYAQAIIMRVDNPEPRKHKQISEDSRPEAVANPEKASGGDNAATESPEAPSTEGGGEAKTLDLHI